MKKNLYEYFNCKNKDELYELVKNKDESVKIYFQKKKEIFFIQN